MRSIGFLAHDQISLARPRTFLSRVDADWLVAELLAERITNKVIRAFAPDSAFRALSQKYSSRNCRVTGTPGKIPSVDLPGIRFEQPKSQPQRNMGLIHWHWRHSEQQLSAVAG
jgi:hypothetical protein